MENEEIKMKKIVDKPPVVKKKGLGTKFKEVFFANSADNIGNNILHDIVIPVVKNTVSDIITTAVDMALWEDGGSSRRRTSKSSSNEVVSYSSYYTGGKSAMNKPRSSTRKMTSEIIWFEDRREAINVRNELIDSVKRYSSLSVANFHEMLDIPTNSSEYKFGWTYLDENNCQVMRASKGGYELILPDAEYLD